MSISKKIFIFSDINLWYGNTAGVNRVNNYARLLVANKENIDVMLVSVRNFLNNQEFYQVDNHIFTNHINSSYKDLYGLSKIFFNLRFSLLLFKFLNKREKNASYIIYPSFNMSFTLSLFLILKLLRRKNIFFEVNEIRRYILEKEINSVKSFFQHCINSIKLFYYEQIWKYADGLICISKNIRDYALNFNRNIVVIPILSTINNEYLPLLDKSGNIFEIFFSGYISIRKENILELFIALNKLNKIKNGWKFTYCGPIEAYDKKIIDDYIEKNSLSSKIQYLGNLDQCEVIELQRKATLLVITRRNTQQNYYGFPTKLAEYAVSGTPIMMTNTGVLSNFFQDNSNCFMINGYESEDIFNKLIFIMNIDNQKRRHIADNAFKTAKQYFRAENYSDILIDFLNSK